MNLIEKLSAIQQKIKAPKNLYNLFGKYPYRNAESILEAFKPYESEYHVSLTITDEIVVVANRIYIKATAKLLDCESSETLFTTAFAREADTKKGMDESQVTGSTSSYARKYALNGLLLLDDSKDSDTDEFHDESRKKAEIVDREKETLTTDLSKELMRCGYNWGHVKKTYNVNSVEEMSIPQLKDCIEKMKSFPDKETK